MTITDMTGEIEQTDTLKYTCLECKYKTKVKGEMNTHVHSVHASVAIEQIKFVCGKCSHEFVKEDDFNEHVKIHDVPKDDDSKLLVNDDERNEVSLNLEELTGTVKDCELYRCTKCAFSFPELLDLNSHTKMEHKR